uniref:Mediator of RNA polymerase II transcription subunit 17 n=1 Tax=Blastobotrys adeninivorans TaxID=409370 RepID=A0A060TDV7_BLAAD
MSSFEDVVVSLTPGNGKDNENELSLGQIIPRITLERGSFANVTEQSLLEEIAAEHRSKEQAEGDEMEVDQGSEQGAQVKQEPEKEGTEEPEVQEQQEQDFDKARAELVRLVGVAQNESALSLDFVSLLLSSLRPAAGTTSMSPHLKQHVPPGSLGADSLWTGPREEDNRVGAGWKLQSLSRASDLLNNAASRLKDEIGKERTYWQAIRETVRGGEVLFKIRKGDVRGLGIKYGFGDSGSEYRDRGIAMISRRPRDGKMTFKFDMAKRRHVVRVSLYNVDTSTGERALVGRSSCRRLLLEETSVREEIKNARTLIFEEELFYEIVQEAQRLASYKVNVTDGKVVINLYDEQIEIERVDPTELLEQGEQDEDVSLRAELISSALHVLLCYAHRRNLQRRRQIPAPMNSKVKPTPASIYLLRPIIAHLQHDKVITRTSRLLDMLVQGYDDAKVQLDRYSDRKDGDTTSYLGRLLYPPLSTYTIHAKDVTMTIDTGTPLQSYNPLYNVKAKRGEDTISSTGLYELTELEDWVSWILKGTN